MTGIAGPGVTLDDLTVLKQLMAISTLRGTDGTGVLQGHFDKNNKSTYFIEKSTYEVNYFLWYHRYAKDRNSLLFYTGDNVFMAHTRWATVGNLTNENCHPFDTGNIIGMHNGTLKDWEYLIGHKDKTDSEVFLGDIAERGILPVLSDLHKDSAYALTLVDKTTGVLTFARNKERSLFCCFHKTRNVLYWHSEMGALEYILGRNRIDHGDLMYFDVKKVYTIHPLDIKKDGNFTKVEEVPEAVKKKHVPVVQYTHKKKHDNDHPFDWSAWGVKDQDYYDNLHELPWGETKPTTHGPATITTHTSKGEVTVYDFGRKEKGKALGKPEHKECAVCMRNLNLVDQFYSEKVVFTDGKTPDIFECRECKVQREQLQGINESHVTIN